MNGRISRRIRSRPLFGSILEEARTKNIPLLPDRFKKRQKVLKINDAVQLRPVGNCWFVPRTVFSEMSFMIHVRLHLNTWTWVFPIHLSGWMN